MDEIEKKFIPIISNLFILFVLPLMVNRGKGSYLGQWGTNVTSNTSAVFWGGA